MVKAAHQTRIPDLLRKHESQILRDWSAEQEKTLNTKLKSKELADESREFLKLFVDAAQSGSLENTSGPAWQNALSFLANLSRTRNAQGFSPSETATFVLSLKQPIFTMLKREIGSDAEMLFNDTWLATIALDSLGLFTTEHYMKTREEVIARQASDMLELSTPVVKLWDGVLALPLIGTLDSSRTQVVMESLLQRIVETNSEVAIIDITGVPTVDTLVAQHLIRTVTAARLMGAECIISGIRPQIAATIVHLGVDLGDVTTKASLADAFAVALKRVGRAVVKTGAKPQMKMGAKQEELI